MTQWLIVSIIDCFPMIIQNFYAVLTNVSMLQASHDLFSAGNVALNCTKTRSRNNSTAAFMCLLLYKTQLEWWKLLNNPRTTDQTRWLQLRIYTSLHHCSQQGTCRTSFYKAQSLKQLTTTTAQHSFTQSNWMPSHHSHQGIKYSIEASSSINTGVETTRSHLEHWCPTK